MSDRQGATRPTPLVSVLIPARDAEATLAATLDSLAAQTAPGWEAVVVDDGSSDGTRALAEARAAADPRVRVVATGGLGVSGARNAGLAEARGERVMFLDADDLLEPDALELLGAACDRPGTDLAHGGWARVWSDGTREPDRFGPAQPDNFPALARGCTVAVHACMVRRDLVSAVGGFDTGLEVCEDWDLWQRLARAGAAFRRVDRRVALYRVRADSASSRAEAIMRDGMRVIDTGHAADPRVPGGPEEHRAGRPDAERQSALLTFGAWAAGIALCHGEPAGHLLDGVPPAPAPDLAPVDVAVWLEAALAVGADGRPGAVTATLREHEAEVDALLADIERRGEVPGLARRARRRLEDLALAREPAATGRLGGVWAGAWDVEGPPPDAPADAERVALALTVAGEDAGRLTLPVVDGALDAGVVADALPDHVTWALLCRALDAWVVPGLTTREGPGGPVVARGGVVLDEDPSSPGTLLDRIGWTLFLQEAWGLPGWPRARFYAGAPATPPAIPADAPFVAVDLADDPDAVTLRGPAWVELSVGGVPLSVVPVEPPRRARGAEALVPALTMATGAELYRAVVREALVGRPLTEEPRSLRARLAAARDLRAAAASAAPAGGEGPRRAPGWGPAVARAARPEGATLVLGRRPGPPGSPSWRRAALPAASAGDLRAAAAAAAEPEAVTGEGPVVAVAYAPDAQALPPPPRERPLPPAAADAAGTGSPFGGSTDSLRADFESLFAAGADPWSYESPYETRKYEQTMGLVTAEPVDRALEIGCAEGHFTAHLAGAVGHLVAADISAIALARARARVEAAGHTDVAYEQFDLHRDPVPGRHDLIVASEVLYYLPGADALAAALARFSEALDEGGRLICAHANLLVDDATVTGYDWDVPFGALVIGRTLAATPGLELEQELRTPLYRIHVARRRRRRLPRLGRRPAPAVIEEEAVWPDPDVAAAIREGGGTPPARAAATAPGPPGTVVPILMYHRVAASGPDALARWRVHPEALEEQLATVLQLGYAGTGLEAWAADLGSRRETGRGLVVTFDDAYEDLALNALPVLRRLGVPATVFVPTDHVGGAARWDAHLGPPAPIMDWDALAHLAAAGVEIGSHSASHRPLTALGHAEVAGEVARSRAAIEDRLGVPVRTFAYPFGDWDAAVRHLVGGAGVDVAVTCDERPSRHGDDPLALPRIEVRGGHGIEDLVRALG